MFQNYLKEHKNISIDMIICCQFV